MDRKYICYCGLYCGNCSVKVKVEPAAKLLHKEMTQAGFEDVINFIPGGEGFWKFLKGMCSPGICISCQDGGGDPGCAVRICAKEKGVELCALCGSYPCDKLAAFFKRLPLFEKDNALIREQGIEAWAKLQDERLAKGFTYSDDKK